MSVKRCLEAALVVALLTFVSAPALPQAGVTLGTIEGTVRDSTGGVLPGATVTIRNIDTGFTRVVVTKGNGLFRAPLLPVGDYVATIELAGFKTLVQEGIILSISATVTLPNLVLEVATVEETVTVTSESPIIETNRGVQSATIRDQAISSLPTNSRDFQDFAVLTPTVIKEVGRDTISMGGQKGIDTNITLDGADFNNSFFGQASGQPESQQFVIAQEAIEEFQALANGYGAEFGRAGGGILNVVTKSGTNDTHGSAFYFGRDQALKGTLTNFRGGDIPNTDFNQKQFGGSVGGPIVTDKAHYFFALERSILTQPFEVLFDRPTIGISNVARFGMPISGVDFIADEQGDFDTETKLWAILGKVDLQISDSNTLSVRYNFSKFEGVNFGASTVDSDALGMTEDTSDTSHSLVASNTTVIGTNKFNEFRFQYAIEDRPRLGTSNEVPNVEIRDCCQWGRQGFLPITSEHTRIQFSDNFTYLFENHDLKAGVDLNFTNDNQTFIGFSGGEYQFSTLEDYLANPQVIRNFRQRIGLNGFTTAESGTIDYWRSDIAFYVQDNWRAKPGLNINFGLRWTGTKNPTVPEEEFGKPTQNPANPGGVFGLSQPFIPNDYKQFAPRLYVAWDPQNDGRQVVRAGGGIFYSKTPALLMAQIFTDNGFRQGVVSRRNPDPGIPPIFPNIFPEGGIPPDSPINDELPLFDIAIFSPDYRNPQVQRFNVGYEKELAPNFSVGVDYVYAHAIRQQRRRDINLDNPTEFDVLGRGIFNSSDRPDPRFRRFPLTESNANGRYQAIIFQVRRRATGNILFQSFYTYSVNKSEDDNERSATGINPSQPENLEVDWGNSDRDIRHRWVSNVVVDLPAHFKVATGIIFNTGDPFNVLSGRDDNGDGRFNDRAFIDDSNRQTAIDVDQDLPDGLQPRNSARQPRFFKIDVRVTWSAVFGDGRHNIDLMLDLFNLTNDANRRQSRNTRYDLSTFGVLNRVGESFQAQFGVRYRF